MAALILMVTAGLALAMTGAWLVQRRTRKEPVEHGGWSAAATFWSGLDQFNPVVGLYVFKMLRPKFDGAAGTTLDIH